MAETSAPASPSRRVAAPGGLPPSRAPAAALAALLVAGGVLIGGSQLRRRKLAGREARRERAAESVPSEAEAWGRLLYESVPEGIFGVDPRGACTFINPAGVRQLGYAAADELIGRRMHPLMHHTRADGRPCPEADCRILRAVREGRGFEALDELFWRADGSAFPVGYRSYPLRLDGRVEGAVAIFTDLSAERAAEAQLQQAAIVFNSTAEAVVITDPDSHIIRVNDAYSRLTGYRPEEVLGKNPRVHCSGRHDEAFYRRMWDSLNRTGQWQGEIWNRRKNGEIYPAWENISAVRDGQGRLTHYVALLSDISVVKQAERRLSHLAYHDTLTGLPNRLLFDASLQQALVRANRHRHRVALLFLDLDRFKLINDSLGHAAGDRLLQVVAGRLRENVRSEDLVARLSGDEFTVILDRVEESDDAAHLARKLIGGVARPVDLGDGEVVVSASVGIGLYPDDADNAADLLKAADAAMYRAKASGRNTFEFHTREITETALAHLSMERELERALDRGELVLYYQPQVELAGGGIVGLEVLLRWQHPRQGLLPAARFIAIAEESGLIESIGDWVVRQACAQASEWARQGLRPLRIGVNLSGRQLLADQALQSLRAGLAGCQADEVRVGVEISESALRSADRPAELLEGLRTLGVGITIDDFGTGHASFDTLKSLPVDALKIDRMFLRGLPADNGNRAIVAALLAVGHGLGLRVIAEGVENEEQRAVLRAQGCDEAQGFLFGAAMPAALLTPRLESAAIAGRA